MSPSVLHHTKNVSSLKNLAALFYRMQDPHRTQDSGCRTTGPSPDLKHTAISRRDYKKLLTVAIMTLIFSLSTCSSLQFSPDNSLSQFNLVQAVMGTDILT